MTRKYFFCLFLLLTSCAVFYGTEEVIYFEEDTRSFELSLGTTQGTIIQEVGTPHKVALADSGYHYWEYCYEHDRNHLHIDQSERLYGCNALRLHFDPQGHLIDYRKIPFTP
ncbi:MAG: hypothetical protein JRF07_01890 [Deltaproteobacteria bacterium]|jgi:hypothetical protein|nr:hypothetical protein [Deltaproteobacteria bacterium]MBW2478289.1 hypothetical protein [Deltaproteobacteria bacterium]MBW2519206.1 hypothetical protein [Deltaproteobacteria bacterium]